MPPNEAAIGVTVRTDERAFDRIIQGFPAIEQSVVRLRQAFAEMGTQAQQKLGAFETMLTRMAGGYSSQDFSRFQRGHQELANTIRRNYRELLRLDEEYFREQERLEAARSRSRAWVAGRDPRQLQEARETHALEAGWIQQDRFQRRLLRERTLDRDLEALDQLQPPELPRSGSGEPSAGPSIAGGVLRRAGRGLFGLLGAYGIPLTAGAAIYGALRQASTNVSEFDVIRRVGTYEDMTSPLNVVRRRLLRVPGLSDVESAQGMGTFAALAGAQPALGRQAMAIGMGFGIGPQAGAEAFGRFARFGVSGETEQGQLRFAEILGEHIVKAQMRGREGEVFQRLAEFLELSARFSLGRGDVATYLGLQQRLLSVATPEQRIALRAGAGQEILGAVQAGIAGTQLFPDMGQEMKQAILFDLAARRGRDPGEMLRLIQTQPLKFLPEILQHPIANIPGGIGDIVLSQMFGLPMDRIPLLRDTKGLPETLGGLSEDLQGKIMSIRDPRKFSMAMAAVQEYREGPKSLPDREELAARIESIKRGDLTDIELQQQRMADAQNTIAELLTNLGPLVITLIQKITDLTTKINELIERLPGFGKSNIPNVSQPKEQIGTGPGGPPKPIPPPPAAGGGLTLPVPGAPPPIPPETGMPPLPGEPRQNVPLPTPGNARPFWEWGRSIWRFIQPNAAEGGELGPNIVPISMTMGGGYGRSRLEHLQGLVTDKGVPEHVYSRILGIESAGGRNTQIGEAGEGGPLQITPGLAAGLLGFNPRQPGTWPSWLTSEFLRSEAGDYLAANHMAYLWKKYQDPDLVAAAWNAGEPSVDAALRESQQTGRPWAESKALKEWTRTKYLPAFQAGAQGVSSVPTPAPTTSPPPRRSAGASGEFGPRGASTDWDLLLPDPVRERTQALADRAALGDRPAAMDDLARSFRLMIRVSIDPLSIIVRSASGEVTDQFQVQPHAQWQGVGAAGQYSGPATSELSP